MTLAASRYVPLKSFPNNYDSNCGSKQTEYIEQTPLVQRFSEPTQNGGEKFTTIGRTSYVIIKCKNVEDSILVNIRAMYEPIENLKLYERLKLERIHAGLTAEEMAEKLGINVSTYSNWERGVVKKLAE